MSTTRADQPSLWDRPQVARRCRRRVLDKPAARHTDAASSNEQVLEPVVDIGSLPGPAAGRPLRIGPSIPGVATHTSSSPRFIFLLREASVATQQPSSECRRPFQQSLKNPFTHSFRMEASLQPLAETGNLLRSPGLELTTSLTATALRTK